MISAAVDLARRLARDAEAVCRHYLSNGHCHGRYWIAGDVMGTPGRSLYLRLTGPEYGAGAAGKWTDAASPSEHGDLLDLIRLNRNLNGLGEAMDEARPASVPRSHRRRISVICHQPRAALPKRRAACSLLDALFPTPRPKLICAPLASPDGSTGLPCAITRRSTTARRTMLRSKAGRRCLSSGRKAPAMAHNDSSFPFPESDTDPEFRAASSTAHLLDELAPYG